MKQNYAEQFNMSTHICTDKLRS